MPAHCYDFFIVLRDLGLGDLAVRIFIWWEKIENISRSVFLLKKNEINVLFLSNNCYFISVNN